VKKGWQALGLGLKPISGPSGYKGFFVPKPFKTRKFLILKRAMKAVRDLRRKKWVCKPKPKPLPKPTVILGCGSKPGSGRVVASPSNPCLAAPFSTPEVVLVPVTTGFLPVCSDDDGGSLSRLVGVPEAPSGTSPVTTGFLPVCSEDDGGSLSRPVGV
jgi:hypothetical protein